MPKQYFRTSAFLLIASTMALCALWFGYRAITKNPVEGYRVVSYDSRTGEWAIVRNGVFDGEYLLKRFTVDCELYQDGNHDVEKGKNACALQIGKVYQFWTPADKKTQFAMVYEMSPEIMVIVEGSVSQHFSVLRQELIYPSVDRAPRWSQFGLFFP